MYSRAICGPMRKNNRISETSVNNNKTISYLSKSVSQKIPFDVIQLFAVKVHSDLYH